MMSSLLMESVKLEEAAAAEEAAPSGLLDIRFYTTEIPTREDAQRVFDLLWENGVDVKSVSTKQGTGLPYLSVVYNKPAVSEAVSALPLAIIPLIGLGLILSLVGIGIFKIEDITNNVAKILLILLGGTIVIVALSRKPLEAAATRYIQAKGF